MLHNFALLLVLIMMSGLGMDAPPDAPLSRGERKAIFQELYANQYGGRYVDGDVIHVNVVRGKEELVPRVDDPGIVYHEVDYTLAELEDLMRELGPLTGEFNIQSLGVDPKHNRLSITLYQADDDAKRRLDQWLEERGAKDMCAITETEYEIVVQ